MTEGPAYKAAERAIRLQEIRDRAAAARPVASAALAGKDRLLASTGLTRFRQRL